MTTVPKGPTNKELVAFAKEQGFKGVSERQLRRWRDEGLLPDLIPDSRGRERGIKRFNPPGVEQQLLVLLRSRERFPRKMVEWAWALWTAGYPVTPRIRAHLLEALDELEERARGYMALYDADPDAFAEFANNLPRGVATFLRGVDVPQVPVRIVLSMATGEYSPTQIHEDFSSVQQAFGRVGRVLGIADLKLESGEEAEEFLFDIARTLRIAGIRSDLQDMPDAELEELRDMALFIHDLWAGDASDEPMTPTVFVILLLFQRMLPSLLIPELLSTVEKTPLWTGMSEQVRTLTATGKLSHQRKKPDDRID